MNQNIHPFYKHSGKFGVHGPVLALLAGSAVAYPLGIAYSYLIKWIPFIYLNFLITLGYGLAFGFLTALLMKVGKVRNGPVALLSGLSVGFIAWYCSWNGFVHAYVKEAPWLLAPGPMLAFMKIVLQEGTWGIGFLPSEHVTGIALGLIWLVEAAVVIGLSALIPYSAIADTPFCETHGCWLDEEKKMDKLDAFVMPDHLAAFQNGDIAPLEYARPRVPASGKFARLTLKHSARCDDYCALSIANVTVTLDKDGKPEEEVDPIMSNLWVPKSMFEYLAQFDHPTARVTTGV